MFNNIHKAREISPYFVFNLSFRLSVYIYICYSFSYALSSLLVCCQAILALKPLYKWKNAFPLYFPLWCCRPVFIPGNQDTYRNYLDMGLLVYMMLFYWWLAMFVLTQRRPIVNYGEADLTTDGWTAFINTQTNCHAGVIAGYHQDLPGLPAAETAWWVNEGLALIVAAIPFTGTIIRSLRAVVGSHKVRKEIVF